MENSSTNEYLDSARAKQDGNDLFAAIGKQVLNLELKDGEESPEDDRVKVVEEIESLCMSCEQNVSCSVDCGNQALSVASIGHYSPFTYQNPFLS